MRMEQSISPEPEDKLSDHNLISNNFNYTETIKDDHHRMALFPSVNPMDEEDFRKDGVIKMYTVASNMVKSVQSGIFSPINRSMHFE